MPSTGQAGRRACAGWQGPGQDPTTMQRLQVAVASVHSVLRPAAAATRWPRPVPTGVASAPTPAGISTTDRHHLCEARRGDPPGLNVDRECMTEPHRPGRDRAFSRRDRLSSQHTLNGRPITPHRARPRHPDSIPTIGPHPSFGAPYEQGADASRVPSRSFRPTRRTAHERTTRGCGTPQRPGNPRTRQEQQLPAACGQDHVPARGGRTGSDQPAHRHRPAAIRSC